VTPEIARVPAHIPDGAKVVVPPDYSGVAVAATLALVARGARGLHLVCAPTSGLQADLLIGAGAVATIETSAVSLGEFGPAPRFVEAVRAGTIRVLDATCPAIHAGLQAAQKGLPFMPLTGLLGSDLLRVRPDWRVVESPFDPSERVAAVPAIRPDVALFHAPLADRHGNVWIGRRRELLTMAQAARHTVATVEAIGDDDLLAEEATAAGTLSSLYVDEVVPAANGAWPLGLWNHYPPDGEALSAYASAARTAEGFRRILAEWSSRSAAA
jgi:glutaconate CoA-transferase subunit A